MVLTGTSDTGYSEKMHILPAAREKKKGISGLPGHPSVARGGAERYPLQDKACRAPFGNGEKPVRGGGPWKKTGTSFDRRMEYTGKKKT